MKHFFKRAGLIRDSIMRLHKLITIPKRLMLRELGYANHDLAVKIKIIVKELFDV